MGLHEHIDRIETKFSHFYFIPAGTVVDDLPPVSINAWPDAAPVDNYAAFKLKEINTAKPERATDTEPRLFMSETAAGYEEQNLTTLKSASDLLESDRTNALYKMLELGLSELPLPGVAVTPRARKETFVDGVLLKETGVVGLGVITERLHTWARFELVTPGDQTNKTAKIQLRLTELASDNNSYELVDLDP